MHYRAGRSKSPMGRSGSPMPGAGGAAAAMSSGGFPAMDANVSQYNRLKKPRNTIDM